MRSNWEIWAFYGSYCELVLCVTHLFLGASPHWRQYGVDTLDPLEILPKSTWRRLVCRLLLSNNSFRNINIVLKPKRIAKLMRTLRSAEPENLLVCRGAGGRRKEKKYVFLIRQQWCVLHLFLLYTIYF